MMKTDNIVINDEKKKTTPHHIIKQYLPNILVIIIGLTLILVLGFIIYVFLLANSKVSNSDLTLALKSQADLTTVRVHAAKVRVEIKAYKNFCGFGGEYMISGFVDAGVNIQALTLDFDENNNAYSVTLPKPHLIQCDFDSRRYFNWQDPVCGNIDEDDLDQIVNYETTTEIVQDLIDGDIISLSESKTEVMLGSLLQSFTDYPYDFVFVEPETSQPLPPSCDSEKPSFWVKNDEGYWVPR